MFVLHTRLHQVLDASVCGGNPCAIVTHTQCYIYLYKVHISTEEVLIPNLNVHGRIGNFVISHILRQEFIG